MDSTLYQCAQGPYESRVSWFRLYDGHDILHRLLAGPAIIVVWPSLASCFLTKGVGLNSTGFAFDPGTNKVQGQ